MKLASMEMTKAEKKENSPMAVGKYEGPNYPYGLCIRLDSDDLSAIVKRKTRSA